MKKDPLHGSLGGEDLGDFAGKDRFDMDMLSAPAVFECEPSGSFEFEPSHWVDITGVLAEKQALARCHVSQDEAFHAAFGYGIDTWMLGSSHFRGAQAGVEHAEAFRPMLARGLVRAHSVLP